jgi:hypothetical protein
MEFTKILEELKAAREAIASKKWFTAVDHAGLAVHYIGTTGEALFSENELNVIGAAELTDELEGAIFAEANGLVGDIRTLDASEHVRRSKISAHEHAVKVHVAAGEQPPALPDGLDISGLDPATIALILELLKIFGPMILDFIKKLMERRKKRRVG